jgi:hypothetical protein
MVVNEERGELSEIKKSRNALSSRRIAKTPIRATSLRHRQLHGWARLTYLYNTIQRHASFLLTIWPVDFIHEWLSPVLLQHAHFFFTKTTVLGPRGSSPLSAVLNDDSPTGELLANMSGLFREWGEIGNFIIRKPCLLPVFLAFLSVNRLRLDTVAHVQKD